MIVALCVTALVLSLLALAGAIVALVSARAAVVLAADENGKWVKIATGERDRAEVLDMARRREDIDTGRNLQARPGRRPAVVSQADVTIPGRIKSGRDGDLYTD